MIVCFLLVFFAAYTCSHGGLVERPFYLAEDLQLNIHNGKIHFTLPNKENDDVLMGEFGTMLPSHLKSPQVCDNDQDNCLQFSSNIQLNAVKVGQCYKIEWFTSGNLTLSDCFDYGNDSWYGGPENSKQYWPFNNMTFNMFSYITKQDQNQAVAEPYWLTSSGGYIYVNKTVPLFIDSNNLYPNGLCLISQQTPPYLPRNGSYLGYKICMYNNAKQAHMNAVKNDLGKPTGVPDERMVQHPIWSTWVRFKYDVNATAVKAFAQDIVDYGFNNSQIEIDDNWESCYGSAQFNKSRFPNMAKLATELNEMGFRITLWNHPFINTNCDLFTTLKNKGYLVKDQSGNVVSSWWDGIGGVIDFTNPDAANWYLNRRRTLMKNNKIDSLKMDAGESSWLPQIPALNSSIYDQPNAFTSAYVRTVSKFNSMIEIRAGHLSQDLPTFVRMLDKDSKWTFENGLPTLLTTLFQLNLNGYTLVLPDMVGGNAYGKDVVTKELFIRWLQANTFMPSIQFSAAPWDFDNETVEISKKFTALHYSYSKKIITQMEKCVNTGVPVNTPIWWIAPEDKVAHSVWSEYMLGNNLLVAPVVEEGAVSRDIYLPKGKWRDEVYQQKIYHGPKWLKDYPAPLDTLPYFTRVGKRTEEDEDM
uniref:Glycoside hydrolase family 31 N-terminal domain-containing protein n=2 Tax=Homalodisca liturata TaxID=320908 RepID=A0A1B6HX93_9HEMI